MQRLLSFSATQLLLALMVVGAGGCARSERTHSLEASQHSRAVLECATPTANGPIMSLFSFSQGRPVSESKQADLCFYVDGDDCAGGAIFGHRDEKGWLFPMGNRDWHELQRGEAPPAYADSTEGVTPITKAQEGFAFWVKTVGGRYAIVRIANVQPGTYDEIMGGKTASIEFEWMWR